MQLELAKFLVLKFESATKKVNIVFESKLELIYKKTKLFLVLDSMNLKIFCILEEEMRDWDNWDWQTSCQNLSNHKCQNQSV